MLRAFFVVVLAVAGLASPGITCAGGWHELRSIGVFGQGRNVFKLARFPEQTERVHLCLSFALPAEKKSVFDDKYPLFQIDRNMPHDTQTLEDVFVSGNSIFLHLYINKTPQENDILREIISGKTLYLQYYLPNGLIKETAFDIDGAGTALEALLR